MGSLCVKLVRKVAFACLTCTFALCGSVVGLISGALKGQTTETGIFRGAGIGAIAGALVSVEFLESCLRGEGLPKRVSVKIKVGKIGNAEKDLNQQSRFQLAIFQSLVDGKIFREWVSPALLKAYHWQINAAEVSYRESSDIFDVTRDKGLLPNVIKRLPMLTISRDEVIDSCGRNVCCAVCLQDFIDGDAARMMPMCRHIFHVVCIDVWLVKHASCPICRQEVLQFEVS